MKIFEINNRLKRMSLAEQIGFLRGELRKEKPHSIRAAELHGMLRPLVDKQLRREIRAA